MREKELDRIEEKVDMANKTRLKQKSLLNDAEREVKDANMVVFSKENEIRIINGNISKTKRQIEDIEGKANRLVNNLFG